MSLANQSSIHYSRLAYLASISDSFRSAVISHIRTCCIVPPCDNPGHRSPLGPRRMGTSTEPSTYRPSNAEHCGLTQPAAGTVRMSVVCKQWVAVVRVRL